LRSSAADVLIGFADVGACNILEEGELALRIDGDPQSST